MTKGIRQFLTPEQQRDWVEGKANLPDADGRTESLEHRFKYAARFEKLMRRPQAEGVLEILRIHRRHWRRRRRRFLRGRERGRRACATRLARPVRGRTPGP